MLNDYHGDDLIDIVPIAPDGAGMTIIIAAKNYDAWILANAADYAARGYTRITVGPHRRTQAFGDKRARRAGDGQ
jgi:hypothetical protein